MTTANAGNLLTLPARVQNVLNRLSNVYMDAKDDAVRDGITRWIDGAFGPRAAAWQPLTDADLERLADTRTSFLGGWFHKVYGWTWGKCRVFKGETAPTHYYAVMEGGGEPTHWTTLPDPPKVKP